MKCPFCLGVLAPGEVIDLGEGETGGLASSWDLRCPACEVTLRRRRVDKVFHAEEEWSLADARAARRLSTADSLPAWACPDCGGNIRTAIPPDADVKAPWTAAGRGAELTLRVDAVCAGCARLFWRVRRTTVDGDGVTLDLDETWWRVEVTGSLRQAVPVEVMAKPR